MHVSSLVVPLLLSAAALGASARRAAVYAALNRGAEEGLRTLLRIVPALVAMLTAVSMLRASGALDFLVNRLSPVLSRLGVPAETAPLILLRPLSGSGALAAASELMKTYGTDSLVGRTAAVMMGSTETTFYTVAVYFGAAGVTKTRHAIPAALVADAVGFLAAALAVRWLFGY
ncbi:MAG: spore maturation protein [Oscillibacter sp.]|nr:spore maturation protein [Oscillibacter sp.]